MKQGEIVVFTMASSSKILHDIAWQILIKNLDVCKESIITAFGIMVAEPKDLPENLKTSYAILFVENLYKESYYSSPIIVSVAKNSPAEEKGIKEKDIILSVNGHEARSDIRNLLSKASRTGVLKLKIFRWHK